MADTTISLSVPAWGLQPSGLGAEMIQVASSSPCELQVVQSCQLPVPSTR